MRVKWQSCSPMLHSIPSCHLWPGSTIRLLSGHRDLCQTSSEQLSSVFRKGKRPFLWVCTLSFPRCLYFPPRKFRKGWNVPGLSLRMAWSFSVAAHAVKGFSFQACVVVFLVFIPCSGRLAASCFKLWGASLSEVTLRQDLGIHRGTFSLSGLAGLFSSKVHCM